MTLNAIIENEILAKISEFTAPLNYELRIFSRMEYLMSLELSRLKRRWLAFF